ncbi:MAG: nucleotidyl transferase AbiEii/AbiGii toxin family protein [Candidatus Omnitrophica bacterium]|nr:nucleotidyl transferase AbiEii/AbiGii toxin family protein [Candidatus Omnitrophota bacterium]
MLDKETAKDLAKEFRIDLFTIYREYFQLLFLKYFYYQVGSGKIYFKGGTALKFLYNSFRFSEDLDFSSLVSAKKIGIIIEETLKDLNKEIGNVEFRKEKTLKNSFSGRLVQKVDFFKFPLTTRLDFSLREKPILTDVSLIETRFPVSPSPQVSHLKIEEILAEKIRTLFTRTRGRDIFDLYFILSKGISIDWNLVNKKMDFYKKKASLEQLIEVIKSFPQSEIKTDVTKFLPLTHRNLIPRLKNLILEKIKNL